jgi:PHD/YefM family antitoxin component YafN of YafNO toxin-antitoxin module
MKLDTKAMVSMTDFRREMTTMLDQLRREEDGKIVVVKNGEVECVVVTPDTYEKLVPDAG